ncbi:MAG: hypothetical protein IT182_14580 [Acidobacteria bacterium]|nr:hypothetical protein [Acidobacteriota bacterium]
MRATTAPASRADQVVEVNDRGARVSRRAIGVGEGVHVVARGRLVHIGEIVDEFWQPSTIMPPHEEILTLLRASPWCPDVFTFAERLPQPQRRYEYPVEWESLAVAEFDTYHAWLEGVNRSVRKHIRRAEREGVIVRETPFSETVVAGIHAVYNEVPVRQGRPFWHYGKDLATVRADNATYQERSTFLSAMVGDEFVGFIKMVDIEPGVCALMQILSRVSHQDMRPTNALLAKAVEVSVDRGVRQLVYGHYAYGSKQESTLADFKENNGFKRVAVPRYYVPLTMRGTIGLRLGLHKPVVDRLPSGLRSSLSAIRSRWHASRQGSY